MNRRAVWLLSFAILLGCSSNDEARKAEIKTRLATAIPPNATIDQVTSYLDSQNIEHSKYMAQSSDSGKILAAVRDRSKFEIVRADFGITFQFNDQHRLVKYDVKPHYTGP